VSAAGHKITLTPRVHFRPSQGAARSTLRASPCNEASVRSVHHWLSAVPPFLVTVCPVDFFLSSACRKLLK
jgi:hypothetical protein